MNNIINYTKSELAKINIIKVNDDNTSKAASENIKLANNLIKYFKEQTEDEYKEKKEYTTNRNKIINEIKELIDKQKIYIGDYELSINRKTNKQEYASSTVSEDYDCEVVDSYMFITALYETNREYWIRELFKEFPIGKLKSFVSSLEIKKFPGLNINIKPKVIIR